MQEQLNMQLLDAVRNIDVTDLEKVLREYRRNPAYELEFGKAILLGK